ncbi:MAG: hypothetical protein BMS9Abin29_1710 [Gemmatimonadota bacterium]|nr:MAG: hypothetical protein BMS9Abin29_1710 [Gemmatimonadota bacterium]
MGSGLERPKLAKVRIDFLVFSPKREKAPRDPESRGASAQLGKARRQRPRLISASWMSMYVDVALTNVS